MWNITKELQMTCTEKTGAVFGTVDLLTYLKIRE